MEEEKSSVEAEKEAVKARLYRIAQRANVVTIVAVEEYMDGNYAKADLMRGYAIELMREIVNCLEPIRVAAFKNKGVDK